MYFCLQQRLLVSLLFLFFLLFSNSVFAENSSFTTVATPFVITGNANNHDIISYFPKENIYKTSESFSDESMFGVIVDDPVLYMESEISLKENARPVVRYGETVVNVSTLGGDINVGDIVTTSSVPGVGQKAKYEDASYILGFALGPISFNGKTEVRDGEEIKFGTVPIALRIGPYMTKDGAAFVAFGKEKGKDFFLNNNGTGTSASTDKYALNMFKIFRYILATVIAVTSIIVSVGHFGTTFKESVVSVGRNPLAKSHIRSILLWNMLWMIIISGAGITLAVMIIIFQ
jgi:hypothetical protein